MKSLIALLALALVWGTALQAQTSTTNSSNDPFHVSTERFAKAEKIQDIVPPLRGVDVESFELSIKVLNTTSLQQFNINGNDLHKTVRTQLATLPSGSQLWIDNIVYKTSQPTLKQFYAIEVK